MSELIGPLLPYLSRVIPGLAIAAALLAALPRGMAALRITVYLMAFILIRDAMTPLGFWSFGTTGVFWIRFADNGPLLALLGLGSLAMVGVMLAAEPGLRRLVRWRIGPALPGMAEGLGALGSAPGRDDVRQSL